MRSGGMLGAEKYMQKHHSLGPTDGFYSYADLEQHVTNWLLTMATSPAAERETAPRTFAATSE